MPAGPSCKGIFGTTYMFGKWKSYGLGVRYALECEAKEECAAFGLNFKCCIMEGRITINF